MTAALGQHFFRREYGRLVALLLRRVGARHLDLVEDSVQLALAAAVEAWPRASTPENPSAWLYRVAHNHLLAELRRIARHAELDAQQGLNGEVAANAVQAFMGGDVRDASLRMLFACCDDALPAESQLVLALKVLCGFDVREISERLFISEANAYKRLARAKSRLRQVDFELDCLTPAQLESRLPAVRAVLYVLFTEGYLSSNADAAIRRELCDDAIFLAQELAEHQVGAVPETFALLALIASTPGADAGAARWRRGAAAARRARPSALGCKRSRSGARLLSALGKRHGVFPLSRRGGYRGRALPGADLRRNALGPDRRVLRAPRATRTLGPAHAQSCARAG